MGTGSLLDSNKTLGLEADTGDRKGEKPDLPSARPKVPPSMSCWGCEDMCTGPRGVHSSGVPAQSLSRASFLGAASAPLYPLTNRGVSSSPWGQMSG